MSREYLSLEVIVPGVVVVRSNCSRGVIVLGVVAPGPRGNYPVFEIKGAPCTRCAQFGGRVHRF